MIDLQKIVERIHQRVDEIGASLADVSRRATNSPDTIRNWERALEEDRENRTTKASATTIKLNQIEQILGIELASNVADDKISGEAAVKAMLRRIDGLPEEALNPVWKLIRAFLEDVESRTQTDPRDQSEPASRRRVGQPSR